MCGMGRGHEQVDRRGHWRQSSLSFLPVHGPQFLLFSPPGHGWMDGWMNLRKEKKWLTTAFVEKAWVDAILSTLS